MMLMPVMVVLLVQPETLPVMLVEQAANADGVPPPISSATTELDASIRRRL
jgi:hypothetical protein